jgi:signal transduction histidine kinase
MFNSLGSRLWLSYALLIGITVSVVAAALIVTLLRNPAVYRSTVLPRLKVVDAEISPKVRQALKVNVVRAQQFLETDARARVGIRTAILDSYGVVVADSAKPKEGDLPTFDQDMYPHLVGNSRLALLTDSRRKTWIYWTSDLNVGGYTLFVGTTLPRLQFMQLLGNDVIAPLLWSGAVALLVAFLLAVIMGNWISAPLRRMVSASSEMAAGAAVDIPVVGPEETKELARALNEMHRQVLAGQNSQRDFVANVSHELKTPLTSIQGFAQAILDGAVQTPDALQQAAQVIYSESTRMHRLVLDLLTLARLEGGTADLRQEPVDMMELLNNVVTKFQPQAKSLRVGLVCRVGALPGMVGDGDRLAQVFTNLVDNGLKFTPAGGAVTLNASAQPDQSLLVEVHDTGKGIAPEQKERIFERFYQMDKSRKGGMERGVGLGLPIARQIVMGHGGSIWVDSQPGQGSQFFVRLPLARPQGLAAKLKK